MNLRAQRGLSRSYLHLYKEFSAVEKQHALELRDRVRASGESRIEPLTALGEWVRTPRFSPDGKTLYYTWSGPDRLPDIRAQEPGRCCDAISHKLPTERHVAT